MTLTLLCGPAGAGENTAFATIGSHRITQQMVDEAVLEHVNKGQLYDLRQQAINQVVDDYLISEAARRAHLTPGQYMDRETSVDVTEAMAHAYYNAHRMQFIGDNPGKTYEQLKLQIIANMSEELANERRAVLIARLRGENQITIRLRSLRLDEIAGNHASTGAENAAVKLTEFSDYQCPVLPHRGGHG